MFPLELSGALIFCSTACSAHNILGMSPEGLLKVLMSGTYRGPSRILIGPIQKLIIEWKNCPRFKLSLYYIIISVFYRKNKYSNVLSGTSMGHLQDPIVGRSGDQIMGHSRDVPRMLVKQCFLNSTHKYIKLALTGYSRL